MRFNPMLLLPLFFLSVFSVLAETPATGVHLSELKMPESMDNITVHKLAEDKHAGDFVVFVKKRVLPHKHLKHSETVYVLEGEGIFELDGKKIKISPGHYVKIPQGAVHSVVTTSKTPLKVLSIQAPRFFGKDRVMVK